jgi:hypothetical protein
MDNDGAADFVGRTKHLGQLALVFKHRHGTWSDFGQFLKHLFQDSPRAGRIATVPLVRMVACRHNDGGRHHTILTDCAQNPSNYPMFNHERYTRPCISIGAFEDKKNPGLVVADLCTKAKDFLLSIGKGDPRQESGRDFDYDPGANPPSSPIPLPGGSQVSDAQDAIDNSNVVDSRRCQPVQRTVVPDSQEEEEDSDDAYGGDALFGDEDVMQEMEQILAAVEASGGGPQRPATASSSMDTPSGYRGSEDSMLQFTGRPSTKIRAATLGYLWQFADCPGELRMQFRLLRSDPAMQVLHLCGCGICYTQTDTNTRVHGCVERSHLKLGTAVENGRHKSYHTTMAFATVADYPQLCEIFHRSMDGDGLF